MTDVPGSEALTDEQIAPDTGGQPLPDSDEATDPDLRNVSEEEDEDAPESGMENNPGNV